ncbi:hypothetical protein XENOCAPTIV_030384 [Xenoophorus captivus]|uniref:Uncharacterized protein n=1 Tax=Xenoophorus captivus TaxID=1517983 RepID=A0ABV0S522_9TELE
MLFGVAEKLMHVSTCMFDLSSLEISSKYSRLEGLFAITLIFSSLHLFQIQAGPLAGTLQKVKCLPANHFFIPLAVWSVIVMLKGPVLRKTKFLCSVSDAVDEKLDVVFFCHASIYFD